MESKPSWWSWWGVVGGVCAALAATSVGFAVGGGDVVTTVMLGLVAGLGLAVGRWSRTALRGEAGGERFARGLGLTLAAVGALVLATDLLVLALAWVATSVALQGLLTHHRDRPQALVAAHKKFLVSRLADLALLGGVALIGLEVGSLRFDAIATWAAATPTLPLGAEVAAALFALGAALKCAQLPFHGWLIQVMEAPTPVSALLHAGVVNLGGLLMMRLAPLMAHAEVAQTLLVVIGTTTAVIAALVMTTRVSVKVALAWSTSAQMGFMLIQCGLGAYDLALLHLVGHSLYKAWAFLGAGGTVQAWRARALRPARAPVGLTRWALAALAGGALVTGVAWAVGARPADEPALWALGLVLALGLAPLLATRGEPRTVLLLALAAAGVTALWFAGHALMAGAVPAPAPIASAPRLALVGLGFGALFVVQAILLARPAGRLARALQPRLFAGLWLDEHMTRLTFRWWPPARGPARERAPLATPAAQGAEVGS